MSPLWRRGALLKMRVIFHLQVARGLGEWNESAQVRENRRFSAGELACESCVASFFVSVSDSREKKNRKCLGLLVRDESSFGFAYCRGCVIYITKHLFRNNVSFSSCVCSSPYYGCEIPLCLITRRWPLRIRLHWNNVCLLLSFDHNSFRRLNFVHWVIIHVEVPLWIIYYKRK